MDGVTGSQDAGVSVGQTRTSKAAHLFERLVRGAAQGEGPSAQELWGDRRQAQYAVVFDEARRSLDRQASSLDGVRGRAGTLVAAASLVTSFTGSTADLSRAGPSLLAALGAYLGVVVLAVVIMWPLRDWRLGPDTKRVLEDYIDREDYASLAELHRSLALHMHAWYQRNQPRLNIRLRLFSVSCILLLVEVVALVVELRGRS
jgi:hypothetical protein